jgi:hypothetical protein
MDFLDNTNVRHAVAFVAGAVIGISGNTFFNEDQVTDVDQVAVVDSSPANTAEAVVEVTPETTPSEEVVETPAEAPTVE